jgi:hypothetical protein
MVRPCTFYPPDQQPWYCYDPDTETIRDGSEPQFRDWVVGHPGRTWLIGNEPDRVGQDNLTPSEYATMYWYFYYLIKGTDPSAAVAIGGISQAPAGGYDHGWDWADAALSVWKTTYPETPTMPIDVWNFHYYHFGTDYSFAEVQEPINTWIQWIKTTRNGAYGSTPIWLTEWGKPDGWLNPSAHGDHLPNDQLDPRLIGLMRNWASWMASEGSISRWFWFVSAMGDWDRNVDFDQTAWLLEELTDYFAGTADAGTTTTLTDAELPPSVNHDSWVGATLFVVGRGVREVTAYDPFSHTVTVDRPYPNPIPISASYRIFRWSYDPLTPNFLGVAYMCYCNPGVCSHFYLPLTLRAYTSGGSASWASSTFASPLAAPDLFSSPLDVSDTFLSPLPISAPGTRFVIDEFEYFDDPAKHGWSVLESTGTLETLNYKSDSLKLHATDASSPGVSFTYPGDPASGQSLEASIPFLSFEVADMDGWSVDMLVRGDDGNDYTLRYEPQFGSPALLQQGSATILQYGIGEGYTAGSWLSFGRDLDTDLNGLLPNVHLTKVQRVTFQGPELLDDVMLEESPFPSDTTPPTTEHLLEGITGNHGWYTSTVVFALSASDGEGGSGVGATFRRFDKRRWRVDQGYPSSTSAEGEHRLEGYAVDREGNVGEIRASAFYIDRTRPVVEIAEPQAVTYTQGTLLTTTYTATDGVSGIDTVAVALDGVEVSPGQRIDTLLLSPGRHTVVVTATDVAGWTARESVTFTVDVTVSSLRNLILNSPGLGWIYGPQTQGVVQSLCAKLDSARSAIENGDPQEAENQLEALLRKSMFTRRWTSLSRQRVCSSPGLSTSSHGFWPRELRASISFSAPDSEPNRRRSRRRTDALRRAGLGRQPAPDHHGSPRHFGRSARPRAILQSGQSIRLVAVEPKQVCGAI